ncbi:MAG TPA: hypothetical protein VHI13_05155 [Candidatus Kapabacteria bacterium]|nr:hypothetical protein [Candidatus Kapabacteria bacterium]
MIRKRRPERRADRDVPDTMADRSRALLQICLDAGMDCHGAQRLVNHVARSHGLRPWCDTRTPADYDALIDAVRNELAAASGATASGEARQEPIILTHTHDA